jgi:hypothetical protein
VVELPQRYGHQAHARTVSRVMVCRDAYKLHMCTCAALREAMYHKCLQKELGLRSGLGLSAVCSVHMCSVVVCV